MRRKPACYFQMKLHAGLLLIFRQKQKAASYSWVGL